ncbi:MAG: RDD family protein, partial [Leadbetterella sp.]|nr:RDD family protein [Leadbetterella sp.]
MNKPLLISLRGLARLIDLVLLYVGFGLFYNWVNRDNPMAYDRLFNGLNEIKAYLPFCILYVPLLESITRGFTIGKFICRIRVRKENGGLITPLEALLRGVGSVADFALTAG